MSIVRLLIGSLAIWGAYTLIAPMGLIAQIAAMLLTAYGAYCSCVEETFDEDVL